MDAAAWSRLPIRWKHGHLATIGPGQAEQTERHGSRGRSSSGGSGSNLVKSWRGSVADGEQDPFAEERQAGSSEHLALDHLDAALDRSSA
jgi:hypothetical protein